MKYRLTIEVTLKPGYTDPEGETTAQLLRQLGYKVDSVCVGKLYSVLLRASTKAEAKTSGEEMCKRLLANPTKDNYSITLEETK